MLMTTIKVKKRGTSVPGNIGTGEHGLGILGNIGSGNMLGQG